MKNVKLYNVIFPIWMLYLFPPVLFIALVGNFIIDSIVVIACYYIFKVKNTQIRIGVFYKKSIIKIWICGFLADIVGAIILLIGVWNNTLLPYKVTSAISYNAFRNPVAFVIVILVMLIVSAFIFLFNYKIIFNKSIENKKLRCKIALTIAIVTIPWTFLLPTELFNTY